MARDDTNALIGRTIAGKFAIESIIGAGAMGVVYRAKQIALDKAVAIKVMHRSPRSLGGTPESERSQPFSSDEMFAARFLREAKAASRIDHPNSLRVIDFGEEPDGLLYMAMEFLDGRDLFSVIRDDFPLPFARVVEIMLQALAAIAVAHQMGVVHRDLKPENIMVMSGTDDEGNPKDIVKVCDFGIAKITARQTDLSKSQDGGAGPKLTTAGLVVGTPEYMSPEQGRGETLDNRSDLYSIGVILFQLLTGRVPFEAETALGVVLKHVTDAPPRPSSIASNIDFRLEAICLRAMQKKREDRYQTAREMRAEFRALAVTSSSAMPLKTPNPTMVDRALLPTAATEVALDSAAVRAATHARSDPPRTQSKVTPLGTELDEMTIPKRRWTGLVLAALLLGATVTVFVVKFSQKKNVANDSPPAANSVATIEVPDAAPMSAPSDTSLAPLESASPTHSRHPKSTAHVDTSAPVVSSTVSSTIPSATSMSNATGSYDPSLAHVVLAGITPRNTNNRDVRSIVNLKQYSECYRDGLKGATKPAVARVTMKLDTDDAGRVNRVVLNGAPIPSSTGNCIMTAVTGKTIGGEGAVGADVDLVFVPGD